MPWPEPISVLLARPDSRASQALRWALCGLRASLHAVVNDVPDDPGCSDLRGLLAEVDALLDSAGAVPEGTSLPAADSPGPRLLPLAEAVAADPHLASMLRGTALRTGSDSDIWNDVQRLLLRTPPELAGRWQERCLALATQLGACADDTRTEALPLGHDGVIYPGLTGAIEATGLRSAASAPLDPRVPAATDPEMRFLAGVISALLWFGERDPHLHHCLRGVFRFGVAPLTGDQRQRYLAELLRLWERARAGAARSQGQSGGPGLHERLRERLDLDEALHSLVYQPPADPASWWGRLLAQARETLFAARDRAAGAGCPVHLQVLGGSFADVNRLAPDSLEVDYGVPGEVAACLRVWARVDGEELKGRVLYRPPRQEE
jgi:hypothetical protein